MRPLPQKVVAGLTTTSSKILALGRAGFDRIEIRDFLGVRYQHVRSVLIQNGFDGGLQNGRRTVIHDEARRAVAANDVRPRWSGQQLLDSGFERLGLWQLVDANSFTLSGDAPRRQGVYAFVLDGNVVYVGVTTATLKTRLGHYVRGYAKQKTNARLKALILQALIDGRTLEVLSATPPDLEWNGLPVHAVAGLEAGLIAKIRPDWNLQGVTDRVYT